MAEKQTKVQVYEAVYFCDECHEIKMEATGEAIMINPPLYRHVCPRCGKKMNLLKQYPTLEYRYEKK